MKNRSKTCVSLEQSSLYLCSILSIFSLNGKPEAAANIVNPNKVYSYDQLVTDIKKLRRIFPDLITYKVIGKSEYGRDNYAVSLGRGPATGFINGLIMLGNG
ncbi:hypothetical protein KHA93_13480 [Bacillus sp. FJAT-49732]|uniref:Uncharacterized protein n=1 Tax=Lederbergia citrisecunda TaxID=2833583 RepID=A0A942YLR0_9BACI|nr:hypothetical protein [Lederbergia citrisecunda]MBS4200644.1 hypothetical protein [Lederbergia citrisecunda]